jgi:hypothetical protein
VNLSEGDFSHEDALYAVIARAMGIPVDNVALVWEQLDRQGQSEALARVVKVLAETKVAPELMSRFHTGDAESGALALLNDWSARAALEREDGFPVGFHMQNPDGTVHSELVPDPEAAIYTAILKAITGGGLLSLMFVPHVKTDINEVAHPAHLPIVYLWEDAAGTPMQTINGVSIDELLANVLPRDHRHFQAVREWLISRIEAYLELLVRSAFDAKIPWTRLPRWPSQAKRQYMVAKRKVVASLRAIRQKL